MRSEPQLETHSVGCRKITTLLQMRIVSNILWQNSFPLENAESTELKCSMGMRGFCQTFDRKEGGFLPACVASKAARLCSSPGLQAPPAARQVGCHRPRQLGLPDSLGGQLRGQADSFPALIATWKAGPPASWIPRLLRELGTQLLRWSTPQ